MRTSTCGGMNTDWNCAKALGTGLVITTVTGHTKRWAMLRPLRCIMPLNHTGRNRQVGLEVRPPMLVKKNHPRKREGGSGAAASFLLSQYLGEQRNDGQPNRPSEPESHSLFSVLSGLQMGTSSMSQKSFCHFDEARVNRSVVNGDKRQVDFSKRRVDVSNHCALAKMAS